MNEDNITINNEEIAQQREEYIASLDEEEKEAFLEAERSYDRLMCIKLSRQLNANICPANDPNHIMVDGVEMGYAEWAEWYAAHMPQLEEDEEEDPEEEKGSFFA